MVEVACLELAALVELEQPVVQGPELLVLVALLARLVVLGLAVLELVGLELVALVVVLAECRHLAVNHHLLLELEVLVALVELVELEALVPLILDLGLVDLFDLDPFLIWLFDRNLNLLAYFNIYAKYF